eukprot:symbB.v1.2.035291.t1/scaffold4714.1/size36000/1
MVTESDDLESLFSSDTEDEAAATLKAQKKVAAASSHKEEGNRCLKNQQLAEAELCYRKALSCIWALYRQRSVKDAVEVGVAVDLNLALCYLKLDRFDAARRCASRVLEVDSENSKALYRRGLATKCDRPDEAEKDFMKAWQVSQSPEVRRELHALRFLETQQEQPAPQEAVEEWAVTEQVQDALQEAHGFLLAIAERKIACRSKEEVAALCQQLEDLAVLLPEVKRIIQEAKIVPPPEAPLVAPVEVTEILQKLDVTSTCGCKLKMCQELDGFRPFFRLQERREGEFRSLRVCRCLGDAWSFDVELLRWGEAEEATVETFASALFGPSGKAKDEGQQVWQRDIFSRIFLKDASGFVSGRSGAAWLLLRAMKAGGVCLQHEGNEVEESGLADGMFFAPLTIEGPEEANGKAADKDSARMDSLAICSGEDKRLVVVPSFASVGIKHTWLLLKMMNSTGTTSVDLCAAALGLPHALRIWHHEDSRYISRRSRCGVTALELAAAKARSSKQQMRHALALLTAGSGLSISKGQQDALLTSLEEPLKQSTASDLEVLHEDEGCIIALQRAMEHLGMKISDKDLDTSHEAAVMEMTLRKLQRYGFDKAARDLTASPGKKTNPMAPDRGSFRCLVALVALVFVALDLGGRCFAVEGRRGTALQQVRPEGHPGHGYRTMKSKASWRLREEDEDKHRLLAKLRNPQTKRRELAETVAALQQRRLLTEAKEYTLSIKVLGQLGLWREAVGMLRDMERNGVSPDVITYNAAIMALSRNRRWKEAIELVEEMWAVRITPDVISYTSAISACANTGHWKEALQLLAEMERAGIRADVRVFNAAINACAQAGESERALQLLDSMPDRKLMPDVITYNAAINACAQSGEYAVAFQLIARMKAQGLVPQTRTYNSAINAPLVQHYCTT